MRPKGRLVVPRKRDKIGRDNYLIRATASAKRKLGIDKFNQLKANYSALAAASIVKRRKVEDGMIMSLLQQNMSFDEIRAMFKCGNSRIKRIQDIMDDPTLLDKKRPTPKHAIKKEDLTALKEHLSSYETEDGFPCAHRRAGKIFIVQGLTWTKIHGSYKRAMETSSPPRRSISRVRWREYVRVLYPGLYLSRSKSDLCDRCVRIDIELQSPDLSEERRTFLEEEKKVHVNEAIEQRRV